jgi:ribonuclease HII
MKYIIGIDEVGRGPIAGPVAVGIFLVCEPDNHSHNGAGCHGNSNDRARVRKFLAKHFPKVKESKQLSEKSREAWFTAIESAHEAGKIDFAVSFQSEKSIDRYGISFCIKRCIADALADIVAGFAPDFHSDNFLILLDGGLKAPAHFRNQKTIIKGDAKEPVIALASITAKVLRDRRMRALAKKYPDYGFDVHKGYGTAAHYLAIENHGLSPIHRKSFLKNLQKSPL